MSRPKGSQNRKTIAKRVAQARVEMHINGKRRSITTEEAIYRVLRAASLKGNRQAFEFLEKLAAKSGPAEIQVVETFQRSVLSREDWQELAQRSIRAREILDARSLERQSKTDGSSGAER